MFYVARAGQGKEVETQVGLANQGTGRRQEEGQDREEEGDKKEKKKTGKKDKG